ncbi:MAG: leucyl/phenylalanyl-tRNA--protein transferase [Fimbriimonas sp.]
MWSQHLTNGDALTPDLIAHAYQLGYFPMTVRRNIVGWYRPTVRALFPMSGIHVSSSLAKVIRQNRFEIRFDTSFEAVMWACMRPTDNWISEPLIRVFTEIHHEGWGHCCECWRDGQLVGGTYGIAQGTLFSAESMFHRETNGSKVALWAMINRCRELGFEVFDAQIMNPHLESLGAFEMPDADYQSVLKSCLAGQTAWSRST